MKFNTFKVYNYWIWIFTRLFCICIELFIFQKLHSEIHYLIVLLMQVCSSLFEQILVFYTAAENSLSLSLSLSLFPLHSASADLEGQLVQLNHCDGVYSNYWNTLLRNSRNTSIFMSRSALDIPICIAFTTSTPFIQPHSASFSIYILRFTNSKHNNTSVNLSLSRKCIFLGIKFLYFLIFVSRINLEVRYN